MDRIRLRQVLEVLSNKGILQGQIRESGEKYFGFSCLFAPWKHAKRKDRRPSMTAEIADSGATVIRCHTGDCKYRNSLADALLELNIHYKGALTELAAWVKEHDGDVKFEIRPNRPKAEATDYTTELRKILANPFPLKGVEFLASKGCSVETARRMLCGWVDEYQGTSPGGKAFVLKDAVVFPAIIRLNGNLTCVGAQAREIEGSKYKSKYTTIFSFSSKRYLYGEFLLEKVRGRRLDIVEGPLDANHLFQLGEISAGVWGTFMGGPKVEKIKRAGPRQVVIFVDPDSPGRQAAEKMRSELVNEKVPTRVIDQDKDPKEFTREDMDKLFSFKRRK